MVLIDGKQVTEAKSMENSNDEEENLWIDILNQVQESSPNKLPSCKTLLVLGDNDSGKTATDRPSRILDQAIAPIAGYSDDGSDPCGVPAIHHLTDGAKSSGIVAVVQNHIRVAEFIHVDPTHAVPVYLKVGQRLSDGIHINSIGAASGYCGKDVMNLKFRGAAEGCG